MKQIEQIAPWVFGAYELLVHLVPTQKNYSIINKVGKVLSFISAFLSVKKGGKLFLMIPFILVILASCKTLEKIECKSQRTVSVTVVNKQGRFYTIQVPFCDTILMETVADTLTLKNVRQ